MQQYQGEEEYRGRGEHRHQFQHASVGAPLRPPEGQFSHLSVVKIRFFLLPGVLRLTGGPVLLQDHLPQGDHHNQHIINTKLLQFLGLLCIPVLWLFWLQHQAKVIVEAQVQFWMVALSWMK
jgi:hypothetical protein